MNRTRQLLASPAVLLVVAACGGDQAAAGSGSATAAPAAATGSAGAATSSASVSASATAAAAEVEPGSERSLRERAVAVMNALKAGDAKTAADYCLGKHRDGLEKYIAGTIEKKEQSRAKGYAAWDGKLGEIRIEDDRARVLFFESDKGSVDFLSFRKKDGEWSLDDIPAKSKAEWEKWGRVVAPEG